MKHFKIVGPQTTTEFDVNDNEMIAWEVYDSIDYSQKSQTHIPEPLDTQNQKVYDTDLLADFTTQFSKMTYAQIILLYKECKAEREKDKPFDYDKVFAKTVKFYIDKKHYSPDYANHIATKVVQQQQLEYNKRK